MKFGFNTPFYEQLEFFRQKLNLPSERWDDIKREAHDRAFIVAGAQKADLLKDLNAAVTKAIEQGTGIEAFRKDFAALVQKNGWTGWTGEGSKAGEAWRTKVIYQTNMATSYAAGRYRQMTDPDFLTLRPYWRYVHNDSVMYPRPHHLHWGNIRLTLRHDHPFWKTHFPPNGWGCSCRVVPVDAPQAGDATDPPAGWDVRDSKGSLPGIDKGFDYAPGRSVVEEMRALVKAKTATLPAPLGRALAQDAARAFRSSEDKLGTIGPVSDDFVVRCQAAYEKIPAHIRQEIRASGFDTALTDKLITARPELKNTHPRGWWPGATYENVDGVFGKDLALIAETYVPRYQSAYVANDRAEAVLLHELGHAFDRTGPAQGSLYAPFRMAYAADVARLQQDGVLLKPYFLQKGRAGPSETFAEVFANIHGFFSSRATLPGGSKTGHASELFLECRKVVENALLP